MTTALATRSNEIVVTADQRALITRTVAVGATPDELQLYLYDCARQGVHPLDKLIHFTKRKGKYTPITSIDFMRIRAADSGEMAGSDDARFTDGDQYPSEATVKVYRITQGQRFAYEATARWNEYYPGDGDQGFMWRKMPHTMLGKCAEALALRKGFPRQLAGLYATEELDQADRQAVAAVKSASPSPDNDVAPVIVETPAVAAETLDTTTGEIVTTDAPAPTERGAAFHWIVQCKPFRGAGKKVGEVIFSDRTTATIWKKEAELYPACEAYCKAVAKVVPSFKHSDTWGLSLKAIQPYAGEGTHAPTPPVAVNARDIPF